MISPADFFCSLMPSDMHCMSDLWLNTKINRILWKYIVSPLQIYSCTVYILLSVAFTLKLLESMQISEFDVGNILKWKWLWS